MTIDSSTCWGVAVERRASAWTVSCNCSSSLLSLYSGESRKVDDTPSPRSVKIDDTMMSRETPTEAQVRAQEARGADGCDAPPDHRGGERAARNRRAVPHDAERGRQAGRRGAPHPLPPLPHRGRPVRGLLEPLLHRQPVSRSRRLARDPRSAASGSSEPSTSSTPTTSAPGRCSPTCSATPSSSTSPATPWPRCTRTSKRPPRSSASAVRVHGRRRQLLGGALRHALAFSTWRSL